MEPRLVAILVHGTFAKASKWTRNGALLAALEALPGTTVQRCDWPGTNSFAGRREGTEQICSTIVETLEADERTQIVIIAHSHGGTVCLRALAQLRPEHAERVRGVVCLGTPFLRALEVRDVPQVSEEGDDMFLGPLKGLLLLMALAPLGFFLEWLKSRVPNEIAHFSVWMALVMLGGPLLFLLWLHSTSVLESARERLFGAVTRAVATTGRALGPLGIASAIAVVVLSLLGAGVATAKRLAWAELVWPEWSDVHTIWQSLSYHLLRPLWVNLLWPMATGHGPVIRLTAKWMALVAVGLTPLMSAAAVLTLLTALVSTGGYTGSELTHMRRLVEVEGPRSSKLLLASARHDEVWFLLRAVNATSRLLSLLGDGLAFVLRVTVPVRRAVRSGWGIALFVSVFLALLGSGDLKLLSGDTIEFWGLVCMFSWPVLAVLPTIALVAVLPLFMALAGVRSLFLTPVAIDLLWYTFGHSVSYRVERTPSDGHWKTHEVTDTSTSLWGLAHSVYDSPQCIALVTSWISCEILSDVGGRAPVPGPRSSMK